MDTKYNHKQVELDKNKKWIEDKIFEIPEEQLKNKDNFSIILPPPNVTGKLHLGHAWDGAIQDILIRYKKMQGYNSVWIPGMDHAGIATQSKVEQLLFDQGIKKEELGRQKFVDKIWDWKDEYAGHIRQQWGTLGLSLDYSKEKFTLDKDCNEFVNKVFVNLYKKKLIYQDYRITNWDPKAQTAISDIEVEYKDIVGNEHTFKYINANNSMEYLEVMTTRPETMFGDGVLAVHPEDQRYKHLLGNRYLIPGTERSIELISDEYVTMEKGTGVVKITMAHDHNDFIVAKRHNLKPIIIMDEEAKMQKNEYVPEEFWGLDRFVARQKQVENCQNNGLLVQIKEITHSVGHSERSGAIVEPLLSKQWYLKMQELAEQALTNQNTANKINFYPKRFEHTFTTWMENIQDWCISRQLWWGHQIPVWYKGKEIYVGEQAPQEEGWVQDEDVLDTWFSSGLWAMTTVNLLDDNSIMAQKLFPHSVLVTGYDIIFFWISRMIFQTLNWTDKIPFKNVLIHGLVRDENGKKMSKSLGNGIDPMEVVEKYGADSLRYFLTTNTTPGQDLRYSVDKIESSWNFLNKLWNIARYIITNNAEELKTVENIEQINEQISTFEELTNADKYILDKVNQVIIYTLEMMEKYEFTEVSSKIYNFIWDDFASWYLEVSKVIIEQGTQQQKYQTKIILLKVLIDSLKLLHPFVPFVTEEIYSYLNPGKYLVNQKYSEPLMFSNKLTNKFMDVQEIITALRNFKSENNIKPSLEVKINLNIEKDYFTDIDYKILNKFGKIKEIQNNHQFTEEVYTKVLSNFTLNLSLEGLIDKEAKEKQLVEQKDKLEKEISRSQKMLSNENFLARASEEKIKEEKIKGKNYLKQYEELLTILEEENIKIINKLNFNEIKNIIGEENE